MAHTLAQQSPKKNPKKTQQGPILPSTTTKCFPLSVCLFRCFFSRFCVCSATDAHVTEGGGVGGARQHRTQPSEQARHQPEPKKKTICERKTSRKQTDWLTKDTRGAWKSAGWMRPPHVRQEATWIANWAPTRKLPSLYLSNHLFCRHWHIVRIFGPTLLASKEHIHIASTLHGRLNDILLLFFLIFLIYSLVFLDLFFGLFLCLFFVLILFF